MLIYKIWKKKSRTRVIKDWRVLKVEQIMSHIFAYELLIDLRKTRLIYHES